MKASKFTDAQKAFILKQGADGGPVVEICRKAGISQATYFNWAMRYALPPLCGVCGRYHMWTPPSGKGFLERFCSRSGCSHMSGLFARRTWPLALMKSADQVPFTAASSAL